MVKGADVLCSSCGSFSTGNSNASSSKMALRQWLYFPHVAPHGSYQQHQCRQGQALPVLVGKRTVAEMGVDGVGMDGKEC